MTDEPGQAIALRPSHWAIICLVTVAAALIAVFPQADPSNLDSQYYFGNALRLAQADLDPVSGLREPYVWTYLAGWFPLPMPSFTYWMPLTSFVLAPFLWVGLRLGLDPHELVRVGQAVVIALRLGVVVIGVQLAVQLGADRRQAFTTGLLMAFGGAYLVYVGETDSFTLFALCVLGALWFGSRPVTTIRDLALAGLLAGGAHLARNDGLLVLGVLVGSQIVWWRAGSRPAWSDLASRLGVVVVGYCVIMGPWFARQFGVTGRPLTPGAWQALFMVEYADLFAVRPTASPTEALANWPLLVEARYEAFVSLIGVVIMMVGMGLALPFAGLDLWARRSNRFVQLVIVYAGMLSLIMVVFFGWIAARGAILHSAYALQPVVAACAPLGLQRALAWLGQRRHWPPADLRQRQRVYPWALVLGSALSAFTLIVPHYLPDSGHTLREVYQHIGHGLPRRAGDLPVVAVIDPVGWHYFTGGRAIVQPGGRATDVEAALDFYQVRFVVVEEGHVPYWADLYTDPRGNSRYRLYAEYSGAEGQPIRVFERVPVDP